MIFSSRLLQTALLVALAFSGQVSCDAANHPGHAKEQPLIQPVTVKPAPPRTRWVKRHEAMNARVAKGNVDLIFIGDSITQAWERNGSKIWQQYYGKRNAVNLGISGDRTEHVLWRLQNGNIKNISPKAAVIMIGTNNSGANNSQDIAAGVIAIVKLLQKKLPKTKLLLLATFPRGANSNDKKRKINEGSNAIVKKLLDGKQVFYLDIGQKFLEKDGTLSRKIMKDLLHLSPEGYKIWAEAIEPTLKKLLDEK